MKPAKPPDVNDLHRQGDLPDDLFDGAKPMPPPNLTDAMEHVRALPWCEPDATWIDAEPLPRPYLLYVPAGIGQSALTRGVGFLPMGKVGLLAAAGGAGKTFALCGLALSVVTRRPWLDTFLPGPDLRGNVVLVLGEEDAPELRRRLHTQARAMGLLGKEHGEAVRRILALPGAGIDTLALTQAEQNGARARTAFADALYAHLEEEGRRRGGWDLIVLDPLSRFAGPDVELDNAAATRFIQGLERFTALPGSPTVIVAHHTNKASRAEDVARSASAVRGASGLVDGARWVGDLEPIASEFARFRVMKSNYGRIPPEPTWLKRADEGGLRAATPEERAQAESALSKRAKPSPPPKPAPTRPLYEDG